jgi:regulator of protease activity HflC (stomatin/prohibitin superfamily)
VLEVLQAVTGIFVVVYDGQHALKFTLGRARYVVGPGLHFKWPIIQRFQVRDTRHTTLDLEPQTIRLADDLVYEVDTKVLYQIVDLRKAIIEIDDLVQGLRNRVVLAVQRVVGAQTRASIGDRERLEEMIRDDLAPVEKAWGVNILAVGFSNLSPSPATLEITQLELLARERHMRFRELAASGVPTAAAVALVTGAVVTSGPEEFGLGRRDGSSGAPRAEPVGGASPGDADDGTDPGADPFGDAPPMR